MRELIHSDLLRKCPAGSHAFCPLAFSFRLPTERFPQAPLILFHVCLLPHKPRRLLHPALLAARFPHEPATQTGKQNTKGGQ